MNPRVVSVKPLDGYQLHLTFANGEVKQFDMRPYLDIGVFNEVKQAAMFATAKAALGTVTWDNGADLCPDTLYLEGRAIG